jgi:sec-independent protein translocase protein TatC
MATETEEERPLLEEEGGPVKSFLEHLEDLRWVLIKSVVTVGIGMLLCLIAANYVIDIVKWPLLRADHMKKNPPHTITLFFANTVLTTFKPATNGFGNVMMGTNRELALELVPIDNGSNSLLAVRTVSDPTRLAMVANRPTLLRNLSPVGGFWVAFQVALYGGIVLAAPCLIYYIGNFVLPALKYKEKKYVLRGFAIGTGLFMAGVCFCYFALLPVALRASVQYSEWLGFSADEWRAEDYISFVCKFLLGMGLGFELPVVILTLVKIGILDYAKLAAMRRYMIVVNLILGAVLTTPEVITQVLMFVPLQLLYEITVWIAWYWEWREKKRAQARR